MLAIESARLEGMARSFAQFGRLPEGPRADVDVGELVRHTARTTIPPDMDVSVEVGDDVPMIQGHHDALARALSNVMLNAVDACRDGGSVGVRVRRSNGNGRAAVELTVSDTGCGIPRKALRRLGKPFEQVQNQFSKNHAGSGLGLAISRSLLELHGGKLSIRSREGIGTVVSIRLPEKAEIKPSEAA